MFGKVLIASCCAFALAACSSSSDSDNGAKCIAGKYQLTSLNNGVDSVTCPGASAGLGITCSEADTITLNGDGTYTDTHTFNPDDSGHWSLHTGIDKDILVFDDDATPNNPAAYTAVLDGETLTLVTNGVVTGTYRRLEGPFECEEVNDFNDDDPRLVGKWELKSITVGSEVVTCPGANAALGVGCGAGETLTYTANNRYEDTQTMSPDDSGIYYTQPHSTTGERIIVNDDDATPNNPSAFIYNVTENTLVSKQLGGYVEVSYTRVE